MTSAPIDKTTTPAPIAESMTPAPIDKTMTPAPIAESMTPAPTAKTATLAPIAETTTPAPVDKAITPAPTVGEDSSDSSDDNDSYEHLGCFLDKQSDRVLQSNMFRSADMTADVSVFFFFPWTDEGHLLFVQSKKLNVTEGKILGYMRFRGHPFCILVCLVLFCRLR